MSYVPNTWNKDYFEEPQRGNDLIVMWTTTGGITTVTAISEDDILQNNLIPPSSRMGVADGKALDLIKIYIPTTSIFSTDSLFVSAASPLTTYIGDVLGNNILKARANALAKGIPVPTLSDSKAGKILRIDYLPTSDGGKAMAVITLLMYV